METWGKENLSRSSWLYDAIDLLFRDRKNGADPFTRGSENAKWLYETMELIVSEKQYKFLTALTLQGKKEELIKALANINPKLGIEKELNG